MLVLYLMSFYCLLAADFVIISALHKTV